MQCYALDPSLPVLLRPDGAVQIGWDPRRAVLVRPPAGLSAGRLAATLRALATPLTRAEAHRLASPAAADGFDAVLDALIGAGLLRRRDRSGAERTLSIRVHGRGPLSDLIADGLRRSGARVSRSVQTPCTPTGSDLVVLADALAPDPRLVRDLHAGSVAHLPVRVRDGVGVVGPLVLPGASSCLRCADLHRTDRDPAWPALTAQLREVTGSADTATVQATAALALAQLQQVIGAVRRGGPAPIPATLNATVEVDVAAPSIVARRWTRHPLCGCWDGQG